MNQHTYYMLLDLDKLAEFRKDSEAHRQPFEEVTQFYIQAFNLDKDERSAAPFHRRFVWDSEASCRRLVTIRRVPNWERIEIGDNSFFYPGVSSSLGSLIDLHEFNAIVGSCPTFVDRVVGRREWLNLIDPVNLESYPLSFVLYEGWGVVEVQSPFPLFDARFIPHEYLQYLGVKQ